MKALFALVCFAALLASSQGNAQEVRFIGSFVFVSSTGSCPDWNPTGDRGFARYRPEVAGSSNGDDARIGLFYQDGAQGWRMVSGNPNVGTSSTFKNADYGNLFDGPHLQRFSDGPPVPQVRFISQSPATVVLGTQTVIILAEVNNFDSQAGCKLRFKMVLQRRPL
jgi:hypothetical protein